MRGISTVWRQTVKVSTGVASEGPTSHPESFQSTYSWTPSRSHHSAGKTWCLAVGHRGRPKVDNLAAMRQKEWTYVKVSVKMSESQGKKASTESRPRIYQLFRQPNRIVERG